jgi:hypothetical protein
MPVDRSQVRALRGAACSSLLGSCAGRLHITWCAQAAGGDGGIHPQGELLLLHPTASTAGQDLQKLICCIIACMQICTPE